MNALVLASLLALHPIHEVDHVEVSTAPSMGARASFTVTGVEFGSSLGAFREGTYGTFWTRIEMPQFDGVNSIGYIEHRWDGQGEHRLWRVTFKAARKHPLWYNCEYRYRTVVLWGSPSRDGRVPVVYARTMAQYLTWSAPRMLVRLGLSQKEAGLSASFSFP